MIKDIFKCVWWLGWRTILFLGGVVGFMMMIALIDEVL